ncbi:TPA: hypothetical protein ACLFL6_001810 [Salmonella enterica subsp. salamae serovar 50:b:z6]|uniref:hypothetical protein n=1 Tax=Salmonella enterica TaxID=28901 RepID=UPI00201D7DA8|nr:hypothetical protein [Salmonella enterica]
MAKNDFKPFATGKGANVTSQPDWEALPALLSGFTAGKASSAQVNKALRQASFIAAALAQYTASKSGQDVLDDGDLSGFIAKMSAAFGKDFQTLDATLTALAGLATGADKLPYFTGDDTAGQTDLTSVGRDIIGKASIADILTYLGLGETINLAKNAVPATRRVNSKPLTGDITLRASDVGAISADAVGEITDNGTMASANKPGWWRIAVDDTDTVADFPVYPRGAKLYGYGLMFVEVIDGAWLQHYYSHHGQNAKRQDWATSITANVPWVVDYNTSNPQRDIAGNAATANAANTATKLKTPRTIAGVAFDGTANIDLGFLGYGQLLNDVTASRVKNVSYTNGTSKPVVVYVRFNNENNTTRKIYVNNYLLIEINQITGYDQPGACTFIVPAGGVYRVETTGTIVGWVEMR